MSQTPIEYSPEVIDFVSCAARLCGLLETVHTMRRSEATAQLCVLLPTLYVRALSLPEVDDEGTDFLEQPVTEADYEYIRSGVQTVMGGADDYLEVFVEDMKYSDTPVRQTVSEGLADIYQDVRNFLAQYKEGDDGTRVTAIASVRETFHSYWGQTLVNTLRAVHDICFNYSDDDEESVS